MMRALILLHRWLGVVLCLFFAMWFASGIVMHFVPFPALTQAEHFAGLAPIDLAHVAHGPAEAVGASGIAGATRVRLLRRSDGLVYLVFARRAVKAVRAADLADGAVTSGQAALAIAMDYARRSQSAASDAHVLALTSYDQWTVSGGFDLHRPLYRVALNDNLGTELYVSSTTGKVVLHTTRQERLLNYLGSVAHWIYPTALGSHQAAWSLLLWWLSLLALIGATAGTVVGTLRIGAGGSQLTPYRGWQAWHHWLGLICMLFVLTWIFSGWLSMDDGWLFSTGKPTEAEAKAVTGMPDWHAIPRDELRRVSTQAKEVEWFAFGGQIYRRERVSIDQQRLFSVFADRGTGTSDRAFLARDEINAAAKHLAAACNAALALEADDDYPFASTVPNAPAFRLVCGSDWFHIDGASGALLEKLDSSRRTYRWLYRALHTLDFHALMARPMLRTSLIVTLCGFGLVFSFTGVVIAWRRLLSCLRFVE
ncbi:MAG: PepSY domain-containing protein [Xanthobacteraceae bacterium]